jgi:anaerobic selenocysteine-containing dehydrogenase
MPGSRRDFLKAGVIAAAAAAAGLPAVGVCCDAGACAPG